MPFQACPGVAEVVVNYTLDGEPMVNVFHFRQTPPAPWSAANLVSLATGVRQAVNTHIMPQLSSAAAVTVVSARDLDSEGGAQGVAPVSTPFAGSKVGDCLPNNVALCITLRTARVGRSYRGRFYLPGIAESDSVGSRLTAPAQTAFDTAIVSFLAAMQALTPGDWAVLSRRNQGALRPVGLAEPVTAAVRRDAVLDSQRRRLPR